MSIAFPLVKEMDTFPSRWREFLKVNNYNARVHTIYMSFVFHKIYTLVHISALCTTGIMKN